MTEKKGNQKRSDSKKNVKYDIFFPNVAFEMLAPLRNLSAYIYYDNSVDIVEILDRVDAYHRRRLAEFLRYLTKCQENERAKQLFNQIELHKQKINSILNSKERLISIGGYKGLVRSSELKEEGGVFVDSQTGLPYGLAEINIVDCLNERKTFKLS